MFDQAKPVSRPWRRFLRFSVRGLVVVVLLVGGWLGWIVRSARIQRDAVAAIRKVEGLVDYDWEWCDGNHIPDGKPWAPESLVQLLGVDYFGHVTSVGFGSQESDATLVHVGCLTQLEELNLNQSSVSDAGLQHLRD